MDDRLREKLDTLPHRPGVYLFFDSKGKVIYVGKAKDLANRVRSYFQESPSDVRRITEDAKWVIADIDTIVVEKDKEALITEGGFLKQRPRYNVRFTDDKDFLHIKIDLEAEWPRLELVRRPKPGQKNTKLFGPYHSARSARRTMLAASRHFRLRTCKDSALRNRSRPCLLYQMNRCPGPCVYDIDRDAYLEQVHHTALFLAGKRSELVSELEGKMKEASAELAFERAALYRDQLKAVQSTLEKQSVVQLSDVDQDVFGLYREAGMIQVVVLQVRGGKLLGKREFSWRGFDLPVPLKEMLSSLVAQYYEPTKQLPDEVLLPFEVEARDALAEHLTDLRGAKVTVLVPQRAHRAKLVKLAQLNAEQTLFQRQRSSEDAEQALVAIAERLRLPEPPRRIECFDIAHHQQGRAVAGMAVMLDGKPSPPHSRSYTIKTAKTGDDYGGMYEVLSRRLRRARTGDEGWELPNLLVVDGGRGQLGVAKAALADIGFDASQLPIVGLAKERAERRSPTGDLTKEATVERVYLPGRVNPITIRGTSPLLILCHARDEAHRLAGKLLAKSRQQSIRRSPLEEIPGVGKKLRTALLRHHGSLKAIKSASVDELEATPGVGPSLARKIFEHFNGA